MHSDANSDANQDPVAFVTGAARGIGAATVRELCTRGYRVAAVDACSDDDTPPGVNYPLAATSDLNAVAATSPGQILPLIADVRSRTDLADAVAATLKRFGRLDVVVAAAGVVAGGTPQWQTPDEVLHSLLEVNAIGVWNTATETIPIMLNGPDPARCRFVAAGERGLFHLAGYAASKHAVIGIVRGLAADLVGTGVTAVAVSPGATDTAMLTATAALYDDVNDPAELATQQGLRRMLEPQEIAATIAFCCSAEGAAVNGSVVRAEGGFAS
jgi:SDR family mycofactocin-dependent oxidoreductase